MRNRSMNKFLFLIILLLVSINTLHAQRRLSIGQIRIGAGTNIYGLSKDLEGTVSKPKTGFQFLTDTDILRFKKIYYLRLGVGYCQTSIKVLHPVPDSRKSNIRLSGIRIPLILSRKWIISPSSMICPFTGFSFMAVTNVKHKNKNDPSFVLTDKNFHDVEWAWHVGVRHEIHTFFVDIGFQKGLTYVATDNSKGRGNMIYMNIGLKINRGYFKKNKN